MLGLTNKGHLGIGADADVTVYTPGADRKAMFELPRFVFKAGELVVEQGEIRRVPFGPALVTRPQYDDGVLPHIRDWFESEYTLSFENYAVGDEYLSRGEVVVSR
jgi:formylmethanofuran dehydrogenase subunit A